MKLLSIALSKPKPDKVGGHLRLQITKLEADAKQPNCISVPYDQIVCLQSHYIGCRYQLKSTDNKQSEWQKGLVCVYFNELLQIPIQNKNMMDELFQHINPQCDKFEWLKEIPNEVERKEYTFFHILLEVQCSDAPLDWSKEKETDYTNIPMILAPEHVSVEMWYHNILAKHITTKTMNELTSILVGHLGLSQ
jgi:hypothetical protein